jgi:hypothetical protein
MRNHKSLCLVTFLLCLSIRLAGQAATEYGTMSAASTTGAAASGKATSKSIGGVFDGLNKKLGNATGEPAAAAVTPPAKAEPARMVTASDIKIGMLRTDLVRQFGQPYAMTSQSDEAGFVQKYLYHGVDLPVVVTFRAGKVVRVSPPPDAPQE